MEPPDKIRIVFMGTPAFALPCLEALKKAEDEIGAVVTQPDKPAGRGRKVTPSPVKSWAIAQGLPALEPKSLKASAAQEILSQLKPELILVVAYGKFLPNEVLNLPRLGCVNLHASLLPKYRGPAPIQWALLINEKEVGVTSHFMSEAMDAGDILLQKAIAVGPNDTLVSLEKRLSRLGAELLVETVRGLKTGLLKGMPQSEEQATYAPKLKKEDGKIDWRKGALEVELKVRALNPWPGTFTQYRGKSLKVLSARALDEALAGRPGEIVGLTQQGWEVACSQGILLVSEVQPENGKRMSAYNFALGHKVAAGMVLEG